MGIHNTLIGAEITIFDNDILDSIVADTVEHLILDIETIASNYAFQYLTKLHTIEFMNLRSITSANAFQYCDNLTTLIIRTPDIVPTLSYRAVFNNTPLYNLNGAVYVPDTLVSSYKTASQWSGFATIIKGLSEL